MNITFDKHTHVARTKDPFLKQIFSALSVMTESLKDNKVSPDPGGQKEEDDLITEAVDMKPLEPEGDDELFLTKTERDKRKLYC